MSTTNKICTAALRQSQTGVELFFVTDHRPEIALPTKPGTMKQRQIITKRFRDINKLLFSELQLPMQQMCYAFELKTVHLHFCHRCFNPTSGGVELHQVHAVENRQHNVTVQNRYDRQHGSKTTCISASTLCLWPKKDSKCLHKQQAAKENQDSNFQSPPAHHDDAGSCEVSISDPASEGLCMGNAYDGYL